MPVTISGVAKNSFAYKAGIKPGDILVSINGNDIMDVLDYRFHIMNRSLSLKIISGGDEKDILINKGEYAETGLLFDTYLIDKQRSCKNKCIFCFIDQLPAGLRPSLYFKDDDSRLSFLFGNYITLTNITEHEIARIIKMRISPINISVQTTNPQLRNTMMGNRFAGDSLSHMYRLANEGIKINCQVVLCRGVNDSAELEKTMSDLAWLYPSLQSVSIVPVGLTKFREGLYPLKAYDKASSADVVRQVEIFGDMCVEKYGERLFYPADEFYLKAGIDIPGEDFYGDYAQLENGVGLIRSVQQEFIDAVNNTDVLIPPRKVTVATSVGAALFINCLFDLAKNKWHNLMYMVIPVKNEFFGETITVAGLVTGGDLINQLRPLNISGELLIPSVMLRSEGDIFLDGVSLQDVARELNVTVTAVKNNGTDLLKSMLGIS